jgi:ribosomal protein S18 acetylase RimI-like enzyme
MTAQLQRTASKLIKNDLAKVFEKMESYHPGKLHWYLLLIGVDPFLQGNGFGSTLLEQH